MKLQPAKLVPVFIIVFIIVLVSWLSALRQDFFERLEGMTYDLRVRAALKFPQPVTTNLAFVYIDEDSIRAVHDRIFGYSFGLYWPRQVYGRVVQEIAEQKARAIAFDVMFGDLRPDHPAVQMADGRLIESDEFFALQSRLAGNVILAETPELTPPDLFVTNALAVADVSTEKDPDGILRRVKAFRIYRRWNPFFEQIEADPDYGVDLRNARIETNRIVFPRSNGEELAVNIDANKNFETGENLPSGEPIKERAFSDTRVWHMGVVLAAQELGLDLAQADVDLKNHKINLRGANGVRRVIPVDANGFFYVDWCLPPNDPRLTQVPIQLLLEQNRERLKGETNDLKNPLDGKLVVIGSAAQGNDLTDRGATPLKNNALLVSKHWNVANSIITGRFIRRSSLATEWLLIAILGVLSAIVTWRLRILLASALIVIFAAAYIAWCFSIYEHSRLWLPMVLPVFGALLMTYVCLITWRALFEQAERRRVRGIFSKMVSPNIVNELLQTERLSLGGARREITIYFADVRGFTSLSDESHAHATEFVRLNKLSEAEAELYLDEQAQGTLRTVNGYLALIADIVKKHGGTLDKFIGDCVMAFWGAPTANAKHAVTCVRAAIEAQRAMREMNLQRQEENKKIELENHARLAAGQSPKPLLSLLMLGSGINTGLATVGLMGSEAHISNYTVFGREVNLASRLEGQSGRGHILIGETTYVHLKRDDPSLAVTCIELPPVTVKGIREPVKVYEVPWLPPGARPLEEEFPAVIHDTGFLPRNQKSA